MKRILIIILLFFGIALTVNGQSSNVGPYIDSMWRDIISEPNAHFQPAADSTTFFQIFDEDGGTPVLNVDSTNERVGIGTNSPSGVFGIGSAPEEDVYLFYDNDDVGDTTSGQSLWIYRRAAEGDSYFRIYQNSGGATIFKPSSTVGIFLVNGGLNYASDVATRYGGGTPYWHIKHDSGSGLEINQAFSVGGGGGYHSILLNPEDSYDIFFYGNIETLNTEPNITLHNSTHEDTDGGRESRINFKGEQSGGEETTLVRQEAHHDGAADDQKGWWGLYTNDGSDGDSPTLRLSINSAGATDVVGDFTAGTIQADDGVSGTLELDDGSTEKITLVFTGGILTSRTVAATTGSVLADWTD